MHLTSSPSPSCLLFSQTLPLHLEPLPHLCILTFLPSVLFRPSLSPTPVSPCLPAPLLAPPAEARSAAAASAWRAPSAARGPFTRLLVGTMAPGETQAAFHLHGEHANFLYLLFSVPGALTRASACSALFAATFHLKTPLLHLPNITLSIYLPLHLLGVASCKNAKAAWAGVQHASGRRWHLPSSEGGGAWLMRKRRGWTSCDLFGADVARPAAHRWALFWHALLRISPAITARWVHASPGIALCLLLSFHGA